jgi:hypothetical protein
MDNNETPLEVMQPSAIMAMEKAQIDIQIATAHQYPRSIELFKKRALSMATLDPDTADSCIYVRPVGKEQNAQGKWVEKFAEGPSVRLAEIVAVSYGNLRAAVKVVEQTERYVKCTGMAHDLESNCAMAADVIEATVTKEGKPYSERQRALVAKACAAKAIRDAIFKVVPRALCKPILEAAKKVASGADKPLDERRKKAQAWIGTLKITDDRVFAVLGVKGWSDVTAEHLVILTGLKTAMGDGDETIDSVFPPVQKEPTDKKPEATPHEKATGKKAEPPKTAQDAPKKEKAVEAPKEEKKPQDEGNAATGPDLGEDNVSFDDAKPEKAGEKPSFVPNPTDSAMVQDVRRLLHDSGKSVEQLYDALRSQQALKDGETLETMKDARLARLKNAYPAILKIINDREKGQANEQTQSTPQEAGTNEGTAQQA